MAAGLYDITSEVLGRGHFAVVKLARHSLTSELVALKIVDKTKLNQESLQQHSQEVRVLTRLSEHEHPNIVKLYQVINTKTKLYLVMEYCGRDVCDLYDYIQKTNGGIGLKEQEAKHIFRQICSAIAYCHSLRIVHRDLKPENLLIVTATTSPTETPCSTTSEESKTILSTTSESTCMSANTKISSNNNPSCISDVSGHVPSSETNNPLFKYPIVKLIDFGFANSWQEGHKLKTSCGSLAYSAPEILLGDQYEGDKVDIWGLGCILYILLYGCNPFMQINDNETLIRILDCSFTTPTRSTISEMAIRLIRALLKKDPNARLTTSRIMSDPWFEGMSSDPIFSGHISQLPNIPGVTTPSPLPVLSTCVSSSHSRSNNNSSRTAFSSTSPSPPPSGQTNSLSGLDKSSKPFMSKDDSLPPRSHSAHAAKVKRHDSFPKETSSSQTSSPCISRSPSPATSSSPYPHVSPKAVSSRFAASSPCSSLLLRSKSPSTLNEVHERVISDMIAKKMCSSKEQVERALRLSRVSSGSRWSFSSLPVVGEGVPMNTTNLLEPKKEEDPDFKGILTQQPSLDDERRNDSYITATYNIIKDRMMKDIHGIPNNSIANAHEVMSNAKMPHAKKSHALPGRKRGVSKPPSIGRPPLDERSLKAQLLQEEEEVQSRLKTGHSGEGDILEEEPAVVTLPLQRKCSVVSEEGSCELSGRLSETGSDILAHTLFLNEDLVVKRPCIPSVDIVITEMSQAKSCQDLLESDDEGCDTTGEALKFNEESSGSSARRHSRSSAVHNLDTLDLEHKSSGASIKCITQSKSCSDIVFPGNKGSLKGNLSPKSSGSVNMSQTADSPLNSKTNDRNDCCVVS